MGLIERLFGLKIVKSADYNTLAETASSLERSNEEYRSETSRANDILENMRNEMRRADYLAGQEIRRLRRDLSLVQRAKDLALSEMKDSMALAESYLADQKDAEEKHLELLRLLNERMRNGKGLPSHEKEILFAYFIPPVCETPSANKIKLGDPAHKMPKEIGKTISRISACPYVSGVKRIGIISQIRSDHLRKASENNGSYKIKGFFKDKDIGVELEIATTAKNPFQHEYAYLVLSRELDLE